MNSENSLKTVKALVVSHLKGTDAKVYLFGSRATGTASARSDIDIAIESSRELPVGLLSEIREAIEESTIPYSVDLVDMNHAEEALKAKICKEGILWND